MSTYTTAAVSCNGRYQPKGSQIVRDCPTPDLVWYGDSWESADEHARNEGWYVRDSGFALCPVCRGDEENER